MYSERGLSLAILLALAMTGQAGSVEACVGCHPAARTAAAHRTVLRPHPTLACTSCHRGVGTATSAAAAHGGTGVSALLAGPATAASCAACHVIGVEGSERLARGLDVYLEQGCALCHRALGLGASNPMGPALDALGLRDPAYLRALLARPSQFYPGTPMPPYASLLHHQPDEAEALITFLRSLRGEPRPSVGPVAARPCASCHATAPPASAELTRHDCVRIRAPRAELSCARCHGAEIPTSTRECLYVEGRRAECAGCHEVPR